MQLFRLEAALTREAYYSSRPIRYGQSESNEHFALPGPNLPPSACLKLVFSHGRIGLHQEKPTVRPRRACLIFANFAWDCLIIKNPAPSLRKSNSPKYLQPRVEKVEVPMLR